MENNTNQTLEEILFNVAGEPNNLDKYEIKQTIANILQYGQHTVNVFLQQGKEAMVTRFNLKIEQDVLLKELINEYYEH